MRYRAPLSREASQVSGQILRQQSTLLRMPGGPPLNRSQFRIDPIVEESPVTPDPSVPPTRSNNRSPAPSGSFVLNVLRGLGQARQKVARAAQKQEDARQSEERTKLALRSVLREASSKALLRLEMVRQRREARKREKVAGEISCAKGSSERYVWGMVASREEEVLAAGKASRERRLQKEDWALFCVKLGTIITRIAAMQRSAISEPAQAQAPDPEPEPTNSLTAESLHDCYMKTWDALRNNDLEGQYHFAELPWPAIFATKTSEGLTLASIESPNDLTFGNVGNFLELSPRRQRHNATDWESMRKSIHKELRLIHPDKSFPILSRRVYPAEVEIVKKAVLEVTQHLNECLRICCDRIAKNIEFKPTL
ncbi:hypothetical protein QCA50_013775 [Cerrena zonata]|uniref:Uncharacterized protein n=1 Tax=Cerrena zonata TaxID=2478898 RepID=A0AAW0FUW4_9APHY